MKARSGSFGHWIGGQICSIAAAPDWSTKQLKEAVQNATAIPAREQRLICGTVELADEYYGGRWICLSLKDVLSEEMEVEMLLIRRDPVVASWLSDLVTKRKGFKDLRQAPLDVRSDAETVLSAIFQAPSPFQFPLSFWDQLGQSLKSDKDFLLAAARRCGSALSFASEALQQDRSFVMAFLALCGEALPPVRSELTERTPRSQALDYVAEELKADRSFVLELIGCAPEALGKMTQEFRNDMDVVRAAVASSPSSFRFAGKTLRANKAFARELLRCRPEVWHYLAHQFKLDWKDGGTRSPKPDPGKMVLKNLKRFWGACLTWLNMHLKVCQIRPKSVLKLSRACVACLWPTRIGMPRSGTKALQFQSVKRS